MSELKVGERVYRELGNVTYSFEVMRITAKMAELSNGSKVWNKQVNDMENRKAYSTVAIQYDWYLKETPELIEKAKRTKLNNQAAFAISNKKLPLMSTEDLTTIINIFNKY